MGRAPRGMSHSAAVEPFCMKHVETTGPIDLIRNDSICSEATTHAGLWKARRIQFPVIRCHACATGPEWDSGDHMGCDYLHHIDMVMAGRAQIVHDGKPLDLQAGHAYLLPGNVPVARRCRRYYEVCYVAFRCEWFPGVDVLLDWPDRRPLCLGRWDKSDWAGDFVAGRPPSLNTLLKLQSQIGLWMARAVPDFDAVLTRHIRVHAQFEGVFDHVERNLRQEPARLLGRFHPGPGNRPQGIHRPPAQRGDHPPARDHRHPRPATCGRSGIRRRILLQPLLFADERHAPVTVPAAFSGRRAAKVAAGLKPVSRRRLCRRGQASGSPRVRVHPAGRSRD
jgi:hypothetical protein